MAKSIFDYQKKRAKVCGACAAERGYDAWDIFHKKTKLFQYRAVTKTPIRDLIRQHPCFGYNWDDIWAVKLT